MIKDPLDTVLQKQLDYLKLPYCQENFRSLAAEANTQHWTHLDYLARLVEGEAAAQQDRAVLRRLRRPVFLSLKPWIPSGGTGQRKSTVSRSRTCSVYPSSTRKPMSSSLVSVGLGSPT